MSKAVPEPFVKALALLSLLAGLAPLPVLADCGALQLAPEVPSGATASRDGMLAAQKAVKAYDVAIQGYLNCLHNIGGSSLDQDAALRTLRAVADRFNQELRTFKEKNGA
jgi:hypothetical protein